MSFDVLLATSSVELGVTFRAGLILMDPGHDALSFVQRIGRVARGDEPGFVVVRISQSTLNRKPWLRSLLGELKASIDSAERIHVEAFGAIAMRSAAARFKMNGDEFETAAVPATFRSMPMRAVWCSALFWVALERAQHATTGQRRTLDSFAPKQVAVVSGLLSKLRNSELSAARNWAQAFESEALRLRNIPPRVHIMEPDGRKRPLACHIYATYPVAACRTDNARR